MLTFYHSPIQNRNRNFDVAQFGAGNLVQDLGGVGAAGPGEVDGSVSFFAQGAQAVVRVGNV